MHGELSPCGKPLSWCVPPSRARFNSRSGRDRTQVWRLSKSAWPIRPGMSCSGQGTASPRCPGIEDEAEYLLSLNLGFKLSDGSRRTEAALSRPMSTGCWKYWIREPPVDWTIYPQAPTSGADRIANAAYLHTSACGDFTLLSREDWFALRAYPEFPIWPMHIDLLFCYAAHHAGIGEVVLREPMRIYHTEHLSAAGWTPEGEEERAARIEAKGVTEIPFATATEWIDRMRRFNAPMIFTLKDWGLAGADASGNDGSSRRLRLYCSRLGRLRRDLNLPLSPPCGDFLQVYKGIADFAERYLYVYTANPADGPCRKLCRPGREPGEGRGPAVLHSESRAGAAGGTVHGQRLRTDCVLLSP